MEKIMRAKFIPAIVILLCVTLSCNFGGGTAPPTAAVSQPEAEPTQPAIAPSESTSTPLPTVISAATATATSFVIPGNDPVTLNEYPLDEKYYGFTRIISTPGKLWITTVTGHLLVYDTNGQFVKEIQLMDKPDKYFAAWMAHDDEYVWVMLATNKGSGAESQRHVFRVNISTLDVLPVELPAQVKDIYGRTQVPFWMAFEARPGELWVGGISNLLIFEAENPANVRVIQDGWTLDNLLWDGTDMWASASYCAPQHFLFVLDPEYGGEHCSRPRVAVDVDSMFRFDEMIWVGSFDMMLGYQAEQVRVSADEDPAFPEVEHPSDLIDNQLFINPTFDGRYAWQLDINGIAYYYDPQEEMQKRGEFRFFEPEELGMVADIAFDGRCLWVIKMTDDAQYRLVQVGLPWVQ